MESSVQNFLCYFFSIYWNFLKKLKPNILSLRFTRNAECNKDSPVKSFKFFGNARQMKNCDYTHFLSKNPAFFTSMFMDIMFNLLIFRIDSNHILRGNIESLVITDVLINEQLYSDFGCYSTEYCDIGYYVTLGIMALGIMTLDIKKCNPLV